MNTSLRDKRKKVPRNQAADIKNVCELRQMKPEALQKIIAEHQKWLNSDKKNGTRADFSFLNLKGFDFRNKDLRQAKFDHADLRGARFAGTKLRDVDMQKARLLGSELAGADITGAILPDKIEGFKPLEKAEEISKNARKIFLALILACVYSLLTIATTNDVRLVTNTASSPLPIIGTAIPIVSFYVMAPLVLISIYVYFHFYLHLLWKVFSILPARFQDGRPLDELSYPWLVTAIVRRHHKFLTQSRSLMAKVEEVGTIFLAWFTVPATLIGFWLRYLPRHDWVVTGLHIGFLTVSFSMALIFYRSAKRTIRGKKAKYTELKTIWQNVRFSSVAGALFIASVFWTFSFGAINGIPPRELETGGIQALVPWIFDKLGYDTFVDFRETSVSTKPSNYWQIVSESDRLRSVKGAFLKRADLRYADMFRAFLVKAVFRNADLRGSRLRQANLQNADIRGANLERSDLRGANLSGVDFREANLTYADLFGADLRESQLGMANLRGANLKNAKLEGADLRCAVIIDVENLALEDLYQVKSLYRAQLNSSIINEIKRLKPELLRKPAASWFDMTMSHNIDEKNICE